MNIFPPIILNKIDWYRWKYMQNQLCIEYRKYFKLGDKLPFWNHHSNILFYNKDDNHQCPINRIIDDVNHYKHIFNFMKQLHAYEDSNNNNRGYCDDWQLAIKLPKNYYYSNGSKS